MREKSREVVAAAGKVLHLVEEDPRDFRHARKFLNVYLDSAKTVTENYASISPKTLSPEMEAKSSSARARRSSLPRDCDASYGSRFR
jgi:hypothetical protein